MKPEPGVAYLVESDRDDTVLVALDVRVRERGIEWFDTTRDRAFVPERVEETSDSFRFETGGAKYALRKLTVELYNRRVIAKVDGSPVFRDTDAVQQFYRHFPR